MIQLERKDKGNVGPCCQMLTKAARSKNVPYWKNKQKRIPMDLPSDSSTSEDSNRSESDSDKNNNETVAAIVHVDRNNDLDFIPMATVNASTDLPSNKISASSNTDKANYHWQFPCLASTIGNFANVTIHPPFPSSEEIPPFLDWTNEFTPESPADLFSVHKLPVYAETNRKDLRTFLVANGSFGHNQSASIVTDSRGLLQSHTTEQCKRYLAKNKKDAAYVEYVRISKSEDPIPMQSKAHWSCPSVFADQELKNQSLKRIESLIDSFVKFPKALQIPFSMQWLTKASLEFYYQIRTCQDSDPTYLLNGATFSNASPFVNPFYDNVEMVD